MFYSLLAALNLQNGWDLACHACAQDDMKVVEWLLRNMPQHADVYHLTKVNMLVLLCCSYVMHTERIFSIVNSLLLSEGGDSQFFTRT